MNWERVLVEKQSRKGNLEAVNLKVGPWCSSTFRLSCAHTSMEFC